MDDRKLELVIAAIDLGSLNKAASKCHCTQSAATQAINALERELGCPLLERSHAGVRLTREGELLLPLLREAHESLCRLQQTAENLAHESKRIRLGSYSTIVQTWLPRTLAAFTRTMPGVTFDIRIGSKDLSSLLKKSELDCILCDDWLFEKDFSKSINEDYRIVGYDKISRMSWHPLMDDPFCALVPKALASKNSQVIQRDTLFEQPYIFDTNYVFAQYLSSSISSLIKVSVDDPASIVSMVAAGMGVSVLPKLGLRSLPDSVVTLELDPPGKRTLGAVVPKNASALTRKFVQFLKEKAANGELNTQ